MNAKSKPPTYFQNLEGRRGMNSPTEIESLTHKHSGTKRRRTFWFTAHVLSLVSLFRTMAEDSNRKRNAGEGFPREAESHRNSTPNPTEYSTHSSLHLSLFQFFQFFSNFSIFFNFFQLFSHFFNFFQFFSTFFNFFNIVNQFYCS